MENRSDCGRPVVVPLTMCHFEGGAPPPGYPPAAGVSPFRGMMRNFRVSLYSVIPHGHIETTHVEPQDIPNAACVRTRDGGPDNPSKLGT
jgi:hypothetical protein